MVSSWQRGASGDAYGDASGTLSAGRLSASMPVQVQGCGCVVVVMTSAVMAVEWLHAPFMRVSCESV